MLRLSNAELIPYPRIRLRCFFFGKHRFGTSLSVSLSLIYFEQAYIHLPDPTKRQTQEILAYAVLQILLKNYPELGIGLFETNRGFKFANERLTQGVKHLLGLCKDAPTQKRR